MMKRTIDRYCVVVFAVCCILLGMPLAARADTAPPLLIEQAVQNTGTISGTVTTPAGAPIAGAVVTATGPSRASTTTGTGGGFTLSVVPGVYRIAVSRSGYTEAVTSDIAVVAGTPATLTVTMSQADLSSLRTIGRVSTTTGSAINTSAAVQNVIGAEAFANYGSPQINDVLQRLPDVAIQKLGSQQDQSIVVGGLQPYETQVLIDGHPIALGQYGVWFTQYFPSWLVGSVETQTGPGNTTPFANLAVGGTANIQTPGFTERTTAELTTGYDSYQSQYTHFLTSGKTGNLSYVVGLGVAGSNGYYFQRQACDIYTPSPGPTFAGSFPGPNQAGYQGIIAFCGDFSGSLFTKGELYKVKYDFSKSTSMELGYVGSFGQYSPQGSAWGNSLGATQIVDCISGTEWCNNPQYSSLVGKTINGFFWYPGTQLTNSQQLYTAQIRTTIGNDSLLIRPYLADIQPETYNGTGEGQYPAFFSPDASYPACNSPTAATNLPCYAGGQTLAPGQTIPSTGLPNGGNYFESANGDWCPPGSITSFQQINSPSNTEVTVDGRQLCFQYPYSTYEQDKLYGTTFAYIHPLGEGFLEATYDFHGQSTFAYANAPSNVLVPLSATRFSTISLTGDLRYLPNVSIPFGLYATSWTASGVIINDNPNANECPGATAGDGSECPLQRFQSHIDPHVAFVWRPHPNQSLRVAAGTSTTYPFIGDLSGASGYQPPASGFSGGLLTYKTPTLQPEHSIAYSIGDDYRLHYGAVVSLDITDTVVHNVFQQISSVASFDPNFGVFYPLNIARLEARVATLKYSYAPRIGLGYSVQAAADRSITSGVPASVMTQYPFTLPANGVQICGSGLFTPGTATCIPYLKGYGQVSYTTGDRTFTSLGVDYEGKNNPYYQPPFAILDLTFRHPISHAIDLQFSVQNLLNTNSFNQLAAPNLGEPVTANYTNATNTAIYQGSYPTYLIPAPTRTIRLQARYHFGR